MSNEMIERLKKVLITTFAESDGDWDLCVVSIIAAMREPTDQQRKEWLMMTGSVFYDITWETMIDAALKGGLDR